MKIIRKRILAFLIDSFFLGSIFVLCQILFSYWRIKIGTIGYVLLFVPFMFKDLIFQNASFGKKLMGIAIYDNNWLRPKFTVLIKRTFLMLTVGYVLFWKAKFIDADFISLLNWESEIVKTRVVDRKVLREIKEQAGQDPIKMTILYNEYLQN